VREGRPPAVEGLDGEADPPARLAQLLRNEAGECNATVAQQFGQPSGDRRLADAGPPLEQDPGGALYRLGSSGPPGPRCSGVSVCRIASLGA
jgi:hypothetical protein